MLPRPLPRSLKKVLQLAEENPCCAQTVAELAALAGVAPRTLQNHFRRFLHRSPLEFLSDLRLRRARQDLLRSRDANVTQTAARWGFSHLGRFAIRYRELYGEPPAATLRRCQSAFFVGQRILLLSAAVERPAIAVLPFDLLGPAARYASGLSDELVAALLHVGWLIVTRPADARYHLRGKICDGGRGQLRISIILTDAATGRYLWANRWDGNGEDAFAIQEHHANCIAGSLQTSIREAEICRASQKDLDQLNAWELTMRALPRVLTLEAAGESMALELLQQAMEQAPNDPLPISLAAWCHGLRAGHRFTQRPDRERRMAQTFAALAAGFGTRDALTETLLAGSYTLTHDLATAAIHIKRALALDGSSAWAWNRSGWIKAYGGEAEEAIERFQIARGLAPADPLIFLSSIGIAVAHFGAARYDEAICWFKRGLVEHPTAVWCHRSLAPAYALAGRKEQARQSLSQLFHMYPDLTIAQVRSSLPFSTGFLDRAAEGLVSAGMRPS